MDEIVKIVNHAASQPDGWWRAAQFFILIAIVYYCGKWIVRKYEQSLAERRSDQLSYETKLEEIVKQTNASNISLAVCIDRNTTALKMTAQANEATADGLKQCVDELRECRAARINIHGRHQ